MSDVLIITHARDNKSIPMVTEAVEARGGRVIRFNTDRYPTDDYLSVAHRKSGLRLMLENEQGCFDLSRVSAVWYRRTRIGKAFDDNIPENSRQFGGVMSRRTLFGLLNGLNAFIFDPYWVVRFAEIKQNQIQIAHQVGLETPLSLFTNRPQAVKALREHCPDGMITKMQTSFAVYRQNVEHVVFTNTMTDKHFENLDGLRNCPMIFQSRIPKQLELRVVGVGDRLFAASIDSNLVAEAKDDWRKNGLGFVKSWRPYTLPESLCQKIRGLMDHFRLNYGAMDFILTPDNRYIFLEINPVGEFVWLDRYSGLPISKAIADLLCAKARRRTAASLPFPA